MVDDWISHIYLLLLEKEGQGFIFQIRVRRWTHTYDYDNFSTLPRTYFIYELKRKQYKKIRTREEHNGKWSKVTTFHFLCSRDIPLNQITYSILLSMMCFLFWIDFELLQLLWIVIERRWWWWWSCFTLCFCFFLFLYICLCVGCISLSLFSFIDSFKRIIYLLS